MRHRSGSHFLQIPGPTNVPDRVLRAIDRPTIDHRGPEFAELTHEVLAGLQWVFGTPGPIVVYPASGTGAWEAAIVNALSPGDRVLMFETGQFATLWQTMARRLGLDVQFVAGDWRHGVDPAQVEALLCADRPQRIQAVMVVHNETSTGVASRIADIRRAIDAANHPALFMVDVVSSLGSIDFRQAEWGVDVAVAGSQKGLMLPPGLGFNALSERALAAAKRSSSPRSYWAWDDIIAANRGGFFPYTPSTNLLFGLRESIAMLRAEGLSEVFARHARHGEATRRAVQTWGLELLCQEPAEYSNSLTAILLDPEHDADALRSTILERFDMSLGTGLGKMKGRVFRIGHLGDFNDLMLAGTLCGVQMGLALASVPHDPRGVEVALDHLAHPLPAAPAALKV